MESAAGADGTSLEGTMIEALFPRVGFFQEGFPPLGVIVIPFDSFAYPLLPSHLRLPTQLTLNLG